MPLAFTKDDFLVLQIVFFFALFQNFVEVYDLDKDPYQLENIASSIDPVLKQYMVDQLEKLQHCSGNSCKELQSFYDVDTRLIYG